MLVHINGRIELGQLFFQQLKCRIHEAQLEIYRLFELFIGRGFVQIFSALPARHSVSFELAYCQSESENNGALLASYRKRSSLLISFRMARKKIISEKKLDHFVMNDLGLLASYVTTGLASIEPETHNTTF